MSKKLTNALAKLATKFTGDIYTDDTMLRLYATDASVYRELPLAVAYPKNTTDIQALIAFAAKHQTSLIPRAGGTSLGGQCVGSGIVVDVSRYMNQVLEINPTEGWARVQPGIVRDDLNVQLRPHGLFFSPNTSTANRANVGGMVGNNSCGSYSIVYGDTRRHVLELHTVLSDGTEVVFGELTKNEFKQKSIGQSLESQVYRQIALELSHPETQREIREQFPKPTVTRRNTGYAVDELLHTEPFDRYSEQAFNFAKLLTGSEGTLAFITEIKIHLDPLPPPEAVLVCSHFTTLNEAARATVVAMQHQPRAVEMLDKVILDCTKENIEQLKNRFFVQGDPEIILAIEFAANTREQAQAQAQLLINDLEAKQMGYAHPLVYPPNINKVWTLRSAGLGLLSNVPGNAKPLSFIEDMAVAVDELPAFLAELDPMLRQAGQTTIVYYAHAGAGELHIKPTLDLKDANDVKQFRYIATESAKLVKKFGGSLSGEHGDGRVRGEFIPLVMGERNYALFKRIKQVWDPNGIFNPGKITDTPPMDTSLRYEVGQHLPEIPTLFDFSETGGILHAAEKCNGSGDCRKSHLSGGTMCPSYMATHREKDTTRARANILREILTANNLQRKENLFDSPEIYEVMDLCISCKGCKSECPSNVDMAMLKAEFLHHYHQTNGIPLRTKLIANINNLNKLAGIAPFAHNLVMGNKATSGLLKRLLGFAPQRSMPMLYKTTLRTWYNKNIAQLNAQYAPNKSTVYLFCDEFTNYYDTEIGIKTIKLLLRLGYKVQMIEHPESGRAYLSKGLLTEVVAIAQQQVHIFKDLITPQTPLLGIEPSAILSFRDEYPKLLRGDEQQAAQKLSKNCLLVDEFLAAEMQKGNISPQQFTTEKRTIKLHGHCHQKALGSVSDTAFLLALPQNYHVDVIPSGCCGMAGSFGYEAEHYNVSMQIGELVLFPAVRKAAPDVIIAAPGTSCRHQIKDGTQRTAKHPLEVLYEALV